MPGDEIPIDVIDRYRKIAIPTINGGLRQEGHSLNFMRNVHNYRPGNRLVGRAKTVRYVPYRPDIHNETNNNEDAPEYKGMASCGPGDVLVVETGGARWAAIGGDMVLLHLKMVEAEGLVTDGGIRDIDAILEYGYEVWAGGVTPDGRSPHIVSLENGGTINCGGTTVRQGDLIVGDNGGILCVPHQMALKVLEWCEEHERLEDVVKEMILRDNVPPGKYYNAETFEKIKAEHDYKVT
jgi:regulator of RNase E activity RraA